MIPTGNPFAQYFDLDGTPLDNGYLYFGAPNQNPQTSAIQVYWDADGTIPAVQPIRTLNGYPVRSGTPTRVYAPGVYSQTVLNSKRALVYYAATSAEFSGYNEQDPITATEGQTQFTVDFPYSLNSGAIQVYVNGRLRTDEFVQSIGYVTISAGLSAGDEVKIIVGTVINSSLPGDAVTQAGLASSNGSALVGHIASGTGAVARTLQSKARDIVSLLDYATEAQRSDYSSRSLAVDCVAAFTLAFAAMNAVGGGLVYGPPGTARVDSAIANPYNNVGFIGSGRATRIAPTSTTADVFLLGDGSAECSGQIYRDFKIWPTVIKTAGYAFNARFITDSRWDNVDPGTLDDYVANSNVHRMFGGWYFNRFDNCQINGGDCTVSDGGIVARGNADQSFGAELTVTGSLRIAKCMGRAIYLGGSCGGVYLGRINISECRWGLWCDSVLSGATNREVFLEPGLIIDTCPGWGAYFGSSSVAKLEATGLWIGACGNSTTGEGGISVQPSSGLNARWTGIRVQNCYASGIELNDGSHVFAGGSVNNNGTAAGGGRGIYVANTGVDNLHISGMSINNNGNGTLGVGVDLVAGADNYRIENNSFFGNGTKGINDPNAPSASRQIRDNRGWITENNGTAQIASGASSITVNHGLADTPTYVSISFAGAQDAGAQAYVAPGSFTTTQFTIVYSLAATANRDFAWRATRGSA